MHEVTSGTSAYQNATAQRAAACTQVAIVGAGFLGKCIAIDLSLLGAQVVVCDLNPQTTEVVCEKLSSYAYELLRPLMYLGYVTKSMLTQACGNITIVSDLAKCADATIIIEAIPENFEAKVNLLKTLEQYCSASTILATNTIHLSIDSMQLHLQHPSRFLGMRFFYPCVLISPVELTVGASTSQDTVNRLVAYLQSLQKRPHRGPTKRVLTTKEASSLQFDTAVRGRFYHGLLEPKCHPFVADIITPQPGPPLVDSITTSL